MNDILALFAPVTVKTVVFVVMRAAYKQAHRWRSSARICQPIACAPAPPGSWTKMPRPSLVHVSVLVMSCPFPAAVLSTAPYINSPGSPMPAAKPMVIRNTLKAASQEVNWGIRAVICIVSVSVSDSVIQVDFQNLRRLPRRKFVVIWQWKSDIYERDS